MKGLNRVYIMGHVGNDPELKLTQKGKNFARLSIATNRSRTNPENGESKEETAWHSVFVWGKQSEKCVQYLRKGSAVLVEGYLSPYMQTSESGEKQYRMSVHADRVEFLSSKGSLNEPKFEPEERIEY
jgi:single-strand DNA-binding protein